MNARNLFPCQRKLWAEHSLKLLRRIVLAEPAEPFPTHSTKTSNCMNKLRKSVVGRFRWFRRNTMQQNVWEKVPLVPLRTWTVAWKSCAACLSSTVSVYR